MRWFSGLNSIRREVDNVKVRFVRALTSQRVQRPLLQVPVIPFERALHDVVAVR